MRRVLGSEPLEDGREDVVLEDLVVEDLGEPVEGLGTPAQTYRVGTDAPVPRTVVGL